MNYCLLVLLLLQFTFPCPPPSAYLPLPSSFSIPSPALLLQLTSPALMIIFKHSFLLTFPLPSCSSWLSSYIPSFLPCPCPPAPPRWQAASQCCHASLSPAPRPCISVRTVPAFGNSLLFGGKRPLQITMSVHPFIYMYVCMPDKTVSSLGDYCSLEHLLLLLLLFLFYH